ncbi:hypothetical protein CPT76_11510 [Paenibacillus sp. AR247]|nr:hypothetical protein CPT76_11510 [Paenibacillus sp. AR247]
MNGSSEKNPLSVASNFDQAPQCRDGVSYRLSFFRREMFRKTGNPTDPFQAPGIDHVSSLGGNMHENNAAVIWIGSSFDEPVPLQLDYNLRDRRLGYLLRGSQFCQAHRTVVGLMKYYAYLYETSGAAVIEVPTYPVYPKVDTELLASLRSKQIGYYITYYNAGNRDRSHNIALAAEAIDGTVIFPGERFSFNRVVGIRTTGRGYRRAAVIVRGELSEGVGGGICQVSSTLFNAADRAGLKIVQRYSHSRHVPYVPSGRDATVSWGGPDFVFENAYNQPVLLRAFAGSGSMAVSILSSDVIEYFPKKVPSISHQLPEEVRDITASQSPGHQKKN